jgi:hypothetical protein
VCGGTERRRETPASAQKERLLSFVSRVFDDEIRQGRMRLERFLRDMRHNLEHWPSILGLYVPLVRKRKKVEPRIFFADYSVIVINVARAGSLRGEKHGHERLRVESPAPGWEEMIDMNEKTFRSGSRGRSIKAHNPNENVVFFRLVVLGRRGVATAATGGHRTSVACVGGCRASTNAMDQRHTS